MLKMWLVYMNLVFSGSYIFMYIAISFVKNQTYLFINISFLFPKMFRLFEFIIIKCESLLTIWKVKICVWGFQILLLSCIVSTVSAQNGAESYKLPWQL